MVRAALAALLGIAACADGSGAPLHFLVANDDVAAAFPPSTVSFYAIAADGSLAAPVRVSTGGNGNAGGFFGAARVLVVPRGEDACVYASNAQSENISGIDARTRKLAGTFHGSTPDSHVATNGIGLAASATHLYATFSGSGNIGVFKIQSGCTLQFAGDFHARGLHGGMAEALGIHGNLMVAAYGDGSIESFNISGGMPVSNGDAQDSAGARHDLLPDAVDITRDGRYAIFGGGSTTAAVEVSDISSGKLTPTVLYPLGKAWNAGSVRLSPDERLLYVSNSSGGRVTAAFFDKTTGKVRRGCTSPPLKGFYTDFTYVGAVATQLATGAGGLLYVPEFDAGGKSHIGLLRFTATKTGCTLAETAPSPVAASPPSQLLSIGVYPPRPF
jgi:DNA-binding beta-propeller fold protein YncE